MLPPVPLAMFSGKGRADAALVPPAVAEAAAALWALMPVSCWAWARGVGRGEVLERWAAAAAALVAAEEWPMTEYGKYGGVATPGGKAIGGDIRAAGGGNVVDMAVPYGLLNEARVLVEKRPARAARGDSLCNG